MSSLCLYLRFLRSVELALGHFLGIKVIRYLIIIFFLVVTNVLWASSYAPLVVYGPDGRIELMDFKNPRITELARSVGAIVDSELIDRDLGKSYYYMNFWVNTVQYDMRLCEGERFGEQPSLSNCTTFLISEDLMVTAGHCLHSSSREDRCAKTKVVFGYALQGQDEDAFHHTFDVDDVYSCKEIVYAHYVPTNKRVKGEYEIDYAVFRLDRPVVGRAPLKMRMAGAVSNDADLFLIGHPWGTPMKIAVGGSVLDNQTGSYFSTNLDAFSSNSGSPVFDFQTGIVEGILVRGKPDTYQSTTQDGKCQRINRCDSLGKNCNINDGLPAEHVVRSASMAEDIGLDHMPL